MDVFVIPKCIYTSYIHVTYRGLFFTFYFSRRSAFILSRSLCSHVIISKLAESDPRDAAMSAYATAFRCTFEWVMLSMGGCGVGRDGELRRTGNESMGGCGVGRDVEL
jgi:hypothetical protein